MIRFKKIAPDSVRTGKVSSLVLYLMIALTAIVFGLFFFVGYDNYDDDNPMFNSPLFTDVLMAFVYVTVLAGIVAVAFSIFRKARMRLFKHRVENGIRVYRIACIIVASVCVILGATFLLGDDTAVKVNGVLYDNVLWLRLTDMFVHTICVLLVVSIALMAFGLSGFGKRLGKGK